MKIKLLILSILLMPSLFAADITQGDQLTVEESREVYRYIQKLFKEVNASGDLERIRSDISLGKFGINSKYISSIETWETPLIIAIENNYASIVQKLLSLGADPNLADSQRDSPLHWAVIKKNKRIIAVLIKFKANINIMPFKVTPLQQAVIQNLSISILKMLIDAGADPNIQADSVRFEATALMEASKKGDLKIVQFLLQRKADVNLQGRNGTALHIAVSHGHCSVAKALLDAGAEVNSKCVIRSFSCERNHTPIEEAIYQYHDHMNLYKRNVELQNEIIKCMALLLDNGAEYTDCELVRWIFCRKQQLLEFVSADNFAALKEAIKNHAYMWKEAQEYIHAKYTELFRAVRSNDFEMIQKLLNQGLSINIKDNKDNNLFESAIKARNFELASYIASQADLSSVDFNDNTILHLIIYIESQIDKDINSAQEREDIDAYNKLLEHKRQLNILLRKFIEIDPSLVNTQNNDGNTPLHLAVDYEVGQDTIDTLLSNGASTKIFNVNNRRAIHMALGCKPPHVLEIFMNAVYKKRNYDEAEATAMVYEHAIELQEGFESDCEDGVIAPMAVDDDMVIE